MIDGDGLAMVVVCLVQLIEEGGGASFLFASCGTKSQQNEAQAIDNRRLDAERHDYFALCKLMQ